MTRKKKIWQLPFLAALIAGTVMIVGQQKNIPYQQDSGLVFDTEYHITYQHADNLKSDIEGELRKVDLALSPFNDKSVITMVNENKPVRLNDMFTDVFSLAQRISADTDGAFDITVAPLVNAWGFGFRKGAMPDPHTVDSLLDIIGYRKVKMANGTIVKDDPRIMLDCSSIAKGYGCDVVAQMFERKGVENYMVEIGGEIVAKGINPKRLPWRIGVTKPSDDSLQHSHDIQTVLNVTDRAMATSGNYRNFYYRNGRKYAHTIDPKTGYPVQHNILSATVLADNCATADAYATAFMVMGLEKATAILQRHSDLMAYFIYADSNGKNRVWYSPTLKDKITE